MSQHPDNYDRAKADLLFNVSVLVYVILLPLLGYTIANGLWEKAIPTVIGLLFVLVQVFLFRKFRSVWWSSFFLCTATSVIICININFNQQAIHLVEPFWMIVIVVFAVFMLGVRWGVFFCIVLMTGFTFFVVNGLEKNLEAVLDSIPAIKYFLVVEIAAALFTLIYILSMFVLTTRRSESALREGNDHLEEQNQLVNKQNSEITILLKEIHHRVKNNLQVINSLLRLQSVQIRDEASKKVFEDAQYRIKAIALIHERMYKSEELSDIDSNAYFEGLANDLLRQNITNQEVKLVVKVALPGWNLDRVVPLGLLLNELIANSIEHGKMAENGIITLHLLAKGTTVELTYSDNGQGFAENHEPGFGLELIETLCAQLNGTMELINHPGAGVEYCFVFEADEV
jgi:two-component sensor histidine kinase